MILKTWNWMKLVIFVRVRSHGKIISKPPFGRRFLELFSGIFTATCFLFLQYMFLGRMFFFHDIFAHPGKKSTKVSTKQGTALRGGMEITPENERMSPKKGPFQKEMNHLNQPINFQGMLIFRGVSLVTSFNVKIEPLECQNGPEKCMKVFFFHVQGDQWW